MRVGPDRGLRQLARQAELQSVGLLLHARLGHLADGMDGDGAGELHKVVQGLHRHRQGDGALRVRQGGGRGRSGGDHGHAEGLRVLVAGESKALPFHREVRQGRREWLFRNAQDREAQGWARPHALLPQQQAVLHDRHARPGMVARRPAHAAERRGDGVRRQGAATGSGFSSYRTCPAEPANGETQ